MLLDWRSESIKWTKTTWFRIIDLDEDKEHKSFEIQQIAGIPEDKDLLESDKTTEAKWTTTTWLFIFQLMKWIVLL